MGSSNSIKANKRLNPAQLILVGLLKFYQKIISPLKPQCCRFYPSCSSYALEAVKVHGAIKGSYLTLKRLARCHPLGGQGADPVPPKSKN